MLKENPNGTEQVSHADVSLGSTQMTRGVPVSNPKADLQWPDLPCSAELQFRFRCYRTP